MCAVAARLPTPAARNAVLRAAFADANVAAATMRELVECMHTSAMAWPRFSDKATLFFGLAFDMMLSEYVMVCDSEVKKMWFSD